MKDPDKNSKIYVAGHRGLAGSAILRKLEGSGYTNIVVKTRQELDLQDQVAVEKFFKTEKPEYVFIAAAKVGGIKANMTLQADFIYQNLNIQNNIIWNSHLHDVKKLLFLSSTCVYPRECPQPMKEEYLLTGPFEPTNEGYAVAKIAGMKLCEKLRSQYNKEFFSCIPTNLYGTGDNYDPSHSHVFAALIKKFHDAKVNNTLEVVAWGTGKPVREFLFSDDLADACLFLMNLDSPPDYVNVGSKEPVTIKDLTEVIAKTTGYKGKVVWDATQPDGAPVKATDSTKLKELGWVSKTNLEEGAKLAYEWFLSNKA